MSRLDALIYGVAIGWLSLALVLRLDHHASARPSRTYCRRRLP